MHKEHITQFVSSREILNSCDIKEFTPKSSTKTFKADISKLSFGATVYVCSSAIPKFKNILPQLKYSIKLVTGDADSDVPTSIFTQNQEFLDFVNSDKIIHWYSQNLITKHPKMTAIPIGLDYHTLAKKATSWGPRSTPLEQEQELIDIKNKSVSFWNREPTYCYANFQFLMTTRLGADRYDAIKLIPAHLVYYEPCKIPRKKTWEKQAQFAFVISPHGNGYDCHRTWEALCLGCIPIVKTSPLDVLFEDLPVLIVKNWSDINSQKLRETINEFKNIRFNYEKLELNYWVRLISGVK